MEEGPGFETLEGIKKSFLKKIEDIFAKIDEIPPPQFPMLVDFSSDLNLGGLGSGASSAEFYEELEKLQDKIKNSESIEEVKTLSSQIPFNVQITTGIE